MYLDPFPTLPMSSFFQYNDFVFSNCYMSISHISETGQLKNLEVFHKQRYPTCRSSFCNVPYWNSLLFYANSIIRRLYYRRERFSGTPHLACCVRSGYNVLEVAVTLLVTRIRLFFHHHIEFLLSTVQTDYNIDRIKFRGINTQCFKLKHIV